MASGPIFVFEHCTWLHVVRHDSTD